MYDAKQCTVIYLYVGLSTSLKKPGKVFG